MRISSNEPSSVILRQTKWFQKWKNMWPYAQFRVSAESAEADRRTWLHVPSGTLVSNPSPNKVVSKMENIDPKVPKQAEAKRDGVINP